MIQILPPSRPASILLMVAGLLLATARPARADFDVFCVANGDGTTTCEGWQGGETLTCVGSRGAVSTCSTRTGRSFTCVLEPGGVTTCADNPTNQPEADGTNCTFTGDGNFTCQPPPRRSPELLPGPRLQQSDPIAPVIPTPGSVIIEPSVFGP